MSLANNIQNLRNVISSLEGKAGGGITVDPDKIIEKTVSGSVIRVDDVSEIPHKCTVSVDKDASVWVGRKNLFDITALNTTTNPSFSPEDKTFTVRRRSQNSYNAEYKVLKLKDFAPHLVVGETYTLNATYTHTANYIYLNGYNKSWRFGDSLTITQAMLDSDILWYNSSTDGDTTENVIGNIQIEKGTRATEYEPYEMTEYTISAGQTVKVDSLCPTMTLGADNDATITFGYHRSYGAQTEYDRFWDAFQQNGNRTGYEYAFAGNGWNGDTFKPKYDMHPNRCDNMFARMNIAGGAWSLVELLEQAGVVIDTSNSENHINMFFECTSVTEIPHIDLSKSNYATSIFNFCVVLEKVSITVAPNTVPNTASWFTRCDALEDLTINGTLDKSLSLVHSSKLTTASVQSVIDALADLTGATAQTITFHADVGAKLTQTQKDAISAKNWTLTY